LDGFLINFHVLGCIVDDGKIDKLQRTVGPFKPFKSSPKSNQENIYAALFALWLKNLSESLDRAQDERTEIEIIEDFPLMPRPSKHSESFSPTF